MAIADYVTKEADLLSFARGDTIQLLRRPAEPPTKGPPPLSPPDPGSQGKCGAEEAWLYGRLSGKLGFFPPAYTTPLHDPAAPLPPSPPPVSPLLPSPVPQLNTQSTALPASPASTAPPI